jgi:hypothetical protein
MTTCPAFAGPDSGLGDHDKGTRSLDLYGLVVAFCDHLVSQPGVPARIHDGLGDDSGLWPQFAENVTFGAVLKG